MKKLVKKFNYGGKTLTLIILISVLLLSAISMTIIGLIGNFNRNQDVFAVNLNTWSSDMGDDFRLTLNDDTYNKYSTFEISDLDGLKVFAGLVKGSWWWADSGRNFSGKTVKLTADINCGGCSINIGDNDSSCFSGTFDGQNFTISNFNVDQVEYVEGGAVKTWLSGLFLNVKSTATIKNLRLKDVGGIKTWGAPLVGLLEGGTIENCVIDGVTSDTSMAGIFAAGSGTTKNCYVTNVDYNGDMHHLFSHFGPVISSNITNNLIDCVFNAETSSISSCSITNYGYGSPTVTNCYIAKSEGYELSSIDYIDTNTDSVWVYHPAYNDGYPYLRSYIPYDSIKVARDSNFGSIMYDGTSYIDYTFTLLAPAIDIIGNLIHSTNTATIQIGENEVTAEPYSHYKFREWSYDAVGKTLIAVFGEDVTDVKLYKTDGIKIEFTLYEKGKNAMGFTTWIEATKDVNGNTIENPRVITDDSVTFSAYNFSIYIYGNNKNYIVISYQTETHKFEYKCSSVLDHLYVSGVTVRIGGGDETTYTRSVGLQPDEGCEIKAITQTKSYRPSFDAIIE